MNILVKTIMFLYMVFPLSIFTMKEDERADLSKDIREYIFTDKHVTLFNSMKHKINEYINYERVLKGYKGTAYRQVTTALLEVYGDNKNVTPYLCPFCFTYKLENSRNYKLSEILQLLHKHCINKHPEKGFTSNRTLSLKKKDHTRLDLEKHVKDMDFGFEKYIGQELLKRKEKSDGDLMRCFLDGCTYKPRFKNGLSRNISSLVRHIKKHSELYNKMNEAYQKSRFLVKHVSDECIVVSEESESPAKKYKKEVEQIETNLKVDGLL